MGSDAIPRVACVRISIRLQISSRSETANNLAKQLRVIFVICRMHITNIANQAERSRAAASCGKMARGGVDHYFCESRLTLLLDGALQEKALQRLGRRLFQVMYGYY